MFNWAVFGGILLTFVLLQNSSKRTNKGKMAGECCDNVYLFIPNIIGYARVVLMFVGFYYMPTCYTTAGTCYLLR